MTTYPTLCTLQQLHRSLPLPQPNKHTRQRRHSLQQRKYILRPLRRHNSSHGNTEPFLRSVAFSEKLCFCSHETNVLEDVWNAVLIACFEEFFDECESAGQISGAGQVVYLEEGGGEIEVWLVCWGGF